jgi:hypothetical protein
MDLEERAKHCRVLWEKGRNMYTSFFAVLADVMPTMSEKEFETWCFKSVGVSLPMAIKVSEVLKSGDALQVQIELKRAVRLAREQAKQQDLDIKAKQTATKLTIEKNLSSIHREQAVSHGLKYIPRDAEVAEILVGIANRQGRTRIDNGIDYLRLKELVKSGAEGLDLATGKKWKWEKWAELVIGRPLVTIRRSMHEAKEALSKNDTYVSIYSKPLNSIDNPPVVDKIHHLEELHIQLGGRSRSMREARAALARRDRS